MHSSILRPSETGFAEVMANVVEQLCRVLILQNQGRLLAQVEQDQINVSSRGIPVCLQCLGGEVLLRGDRNVQVPCQSASKVVSGHIMTLAYSSPAFTSTAILAVGDRMRDRRAALDSARLAGCAVQGQERPSSQAVGKGFVRRQGLSQVRRATFPSSAAALQMAHTGYTEPLVSTQFLDLLSAEKEADTFICHLAVFTSTSCALAVRQLALQPCWHTNNHPHSTFFALAAPLCS